MAREWSSRDTALYVKYWMPLRRYALSLGASPEDAEDLVQDTFEEFFERGYQVQHSFQAACSLLMKIMLHIWLNRRKVRRREILWAEDPGEIPGILCDSSVSVSPEETAIDREYVRCLTERIERLKPEWRELLELLMTGVSFHEASRRLGISDEAFRARLFRARKALRQQMER